MSRTVALQQRLAADVGEIRDRRVAGKDSSARAENSGQRLLRLLADLVARAHVADLVAEHGGGAAPHCSDTRGFRA